MHQFELIHPEPKHFEAIQDLCRRVYPFTKPWNIAQLEAHHTYFPDGQLLVIEKSTQKVVGLAFSLIISWDDYSPQDNWQDFTSGGYFHNHNPKKGKTLYGAEIMVDPEYRGRGLGKMLYRGREEIAKNYGLKRIRAGARLRGYSKHQDKLSPEEYVKKVVQKEIFDPTLSFQLNQGFVAIDVAKNYLFNDPESLGYAAVIEWLNPEVATERDFKRQRENVEFFLTHQRLSVEYLPKELRRVVRKMTLLLGLTLREQYGSSFYEKTESYRKSLKVFRIRKNKAELERIAKRLRRETLDNQIRLAHSFSMLLEIVNSCESAYRTWRQRQRSIYPQRSTQLDLVFVLTAHPTEARSPVVTEIYRKISRLILEGLQNNFVFSDEEISSHLRALLEIPMVKTSAPTVMDEAEHIYSIVFHKPIFEFITSQREPYRIRLRTWVGGDKDGHPGINEEVMLNCLNGSRMRLIHHISRKLKNVISDIEQLSPHMRFSATDKKNLQNFLIKLNALHPIQNGDGKKVEMWFYSFLNFGWRAHSFIQKHHEIQSIKRIFEIFPALVLPLELREDAGEIEKALKDKNAAIGKMLQRLADISRGGASIDYAQSLVISHCEASQDIKNAFLLASKCGHKGTLPIVPLFESKESLDQAEKILAEWLDQKGNKKVVEQFWNKRLEVMLGYSDSAKQIGALPSRNLIRKSMSRISKLIKRYQLTPIFFHGSGGSVARGGGSLKEQVSWWPSAATRFPKLTIQGEMIQRTFATKEILHSQCLHFSRVVSSKGAKAPMAKQPKSYDLFVQRVEENYTSFVSDKKFLAQCLDATPYRYLDVLRIGSRPTKRPSQDVSVHSLRAIPWVLCWTQSRVLLPAWWGVGSAWEKMSAEERTEIQSFFKGDPFFSSFVKQLGFTLAKVEMIVWQQYLKEFAPSDADRILRLFADEYRRTQRFCHEITGETSLLWYRPWLEESIRLRSPYIHILNLLQIHAMKSSKERLLKETLVGIACGMLTTG